MALPSLVVRVGLVLAGALLTAMSMSAPARAGGGCADAGLEPDARNGARLKAALTCLLNEERKSRGLVALKPDRRLQRAAERHSDDMVRRRYFDHTSPGGDTIRDRARAARYVPKRGTYRIAENIAWGAGAKGTPERIVRLWMSSAPHRRNVLDGRLRHIGLGVTAGAPDGGDGSTFTLLVGRRS